ncbi:MAG: hypothetical protein RBT51_10525, partial [Ectothiorhodospiraceae bacterium]|nr:hypothetical protein [Ectothiorhodospiraceae bacterium]
MVDEKSEGRGAVAHRKPVIKDQTCFYNMSTLRKQTRNRRIFLNNESAFKALYLAILHAAGKWKMIHHWKPALQTCRPRKAAHTSPSDSSA